ncbi:MAG: Uma2 family endonuclease, partial [Gemmatimonadota bacterium]
TRRRFTVDEYHRMAEAGILGEDDRVELLDGEIVQMTPIGPRHNWCVARLNRLFAPRVGERAIVWVQNSIRLGRYEEPQPDLCLLKASADVSAHSNPGPEDVLLVVEVADTSAQEDRRVKMPKYARAGIPEAWLFDLPAEALEVYRDPGPDGYRDVRRLRRGDSIAPLAFPDLVLSVGDALA